MKNLLHAKKAHGTRADAWAFQSLFVACSGTGISYGSTFRKRFREIGSFEEPLQNGQMN
jgi:hypothetical protein